MQEYFEQYAEEYVEEVENNGEVVVSNSAVDNVVW